MSGGRSGQGVAMRKQMRGLCAEWGDGGGGNPTAGANEFAGVVVVCLGFEHWVGGAMT